MWHCRSCGTVFDKPKWYVEYEDMTGEGNFERHEWQVCPVCFEDQIFYTQQDEYNGNDDADEIASWREEDV